LFHSPQRSEKLDPEAGGGFAWKIGLIGQDEELLSSHRFLGQDPEFT
jgi:hypothetical protein